MASIGQRVVSHIPNGIYGIGGYYTDSDGTQHVIAAANDGSVYEIHWDRQSAPSGPQRIGHFNGIVSLAGLFTSDDNYQHVLLATNDGNMHEIFFTQPQNPALRSPLFHLSTSIAGTHYGMAGFFSPNDNLRHGIIFDPHGRLHDISFSQQVSPSEQLFFTQFDARSVAGISGFFAPDDRLRHVTVAFNDGRIYDFNYATQQDKGSTNFVTNFGENLVGAASFFSFDNNDHNIIALSRSGQLFAYSRNAQRQVPKTRLAALSNVIDVAGYFSLYDNNRHAIVATSDGTLHEVNYTSLG
jgi:hypothetical protein